MCDHIDHFGKIWSRQQGSFYSAEYEQFENCQSDILGPNDKSEFEDFELYYCDKCNIIFGTHEVHFDCDCLCDTYYSVLVKGFQHLKDGVWVDYPNRMPKFEGIDDFMKNYRNYKLNLVCTCDGSYCRSTQPQKICTTSIFYKK